MNALYFYKSFLGKVRSRLSELACLTGPAQLHMNSPVVESFHFKPPDSEIIRSFLQSDNEEAPGAASATSSGKNICSK